MSRPRPQDGRSVQTVPERTRQPYPTQPYPTRQPYQKSARRQKLAALLLDAGRELLLNEGLGLGATDLSFKRVLDHIEATRDIRISPGSVYDRLWVDVRDYQLEVLALAASGTRFRREEWDETQAAIERVLEQSDLRSERGRARCVKELARVAGRVNAELIAESADWTLWTAIWALYSLDQQRTADAGAEQIGEALSATYRQSSEHYRELYRGLVPVAKIQHCADVFPDDETAITLFARLLNALAEGSALRQRYEDGQAGTIELPTGEDGQMEEWDLFGLGAFLLARGVFCHQGSSDFLSHS